MDYHSRNWSSCRVLMFFLLLQAMLYATLIRSTASDMSSLLTPITKRIKRVSNGQRDLKSFKEEKDTSVTIAYSDVSGALKVRTISFTDLSTSWTWKFSDEDAQTQDHEPGRRVSFNPNLGEEEDRGNSWPDLTTIRGRERNFYMSLRQAPRRRGVRYKAEKAGPDNHRNSTGNPEKNIRRNNRRLRKLQRIANLMDRSKDENYEMEKEAISRSEGFQNIFRKTYTVWREPEKQNEDYILKLMRDQIAVAKAYAFVARSRRETELYDSLMERITENRMIVRKVHSDAELIDLGPAKSMGNLLNMAKNKVHDCDDVEKKLRVMVQYEEENLNAVKRQSTFLTQRAPLTIPSPMHCLSLQLTTDYFLNHRSQEVVHTPNLEDPSLYHYAIFSDNVMATSVVVNSTIVHVEAPEKHVFHIVTDGLNFVPMKMWFLVNRPPGATVHVENMDEFRWLNSSRSPVLRQLESKRMREYYFGTDHPSSLSVGDDHLKYRNSKYLSMLNHIRFYLPELYPKLEKILFLDDDVVVQKDLTPLWSIDMKGKANGAVMTCKDTYHRLDTYLNFSNPEIASSFDPKACGWAFGMNFFDLKAWKQHGVTGIYHRWQEMNWDRRLWKLGTLPPGLIAFYNLTHVLDDSWHVLGLGHESDVQEDEIEKAAVIHYNGNYKPWMELAICRFKKYWSNFVQLDNPYLRNCGLRLACHPTQ